MTAKLARRCFSLAAVTGILANRAWIEKKQNKIQQEHMPLFRPWDHGSRGMLATDIYAGLSSDGARAGTRAATTNIGVLARCRLMGDDAIDC